jgi:hypothetical protein
MLHVSLGVPFGFYCNIFTYKIKKIKKGFVIVC